MLNKFKGWMTKKIFNNRGIDECDIDIEKMNNLIINGAIVIDVRSPQEYLEGHVNGAISIPTYEIKRKVEKILKDKQQMIIVYCSTGIRSKKVQKELKKLGYINVYNLYNGIENLSFGVF